MIIKRRLQKLMISLLTATFVVTSFGGTYHATALAAEVSQDNTANNAILGGVLLLGLVALTSHDHKTNATPTPQATESTSTVPSPVVTTPSSSGTSSEEQLAFNLLNKDRQANGLKALKLNKNLVSLAENYAQDMINRNYFDHYNPEGQSPFDRMTKAGIHYSYAGENIAINNSPAGAETAFMNSSGHRANILNANYTDVGVGVRHDKNGSLYVVQEFIAK